RGGIPPPGAPGAREHPYDVEDAERLGGLRALRRELRARVERGPTVDVPADEDVLRDVAGVPVLGARHAVDLAKARCLEHGARDLAGTVVVAGDLLQRVLGAVALSG